jgi:hypothetical protein
MPKIINTGPVPTVDAVPVTNHPAALAAASSDTYPSDHAKPATGGGGTK